MLIVQTVLQVLLTASEIDLLSLGTTFPVRVIHAFQPLVNLGLTPPIPLLSIGARAGKAHDFSQYSG